MCGDGFWALTNFFQCLNESNSTQDVYVKTVAMFLKDGTVIDLMNTVVAITIT